MLLFFVVGFFPPATSLACGKELKSQQRPLRRGNSSLNKTFFCFVISFKLICVFVAKVNKLKAVVFLCFCCLLCWKHCVEHISNTTINSAYILQHAGYNHTLFIHLGAASAIYGVPYLGRTYPKETSLWTFTAYTKWWRRWGKFTSFECCWTFCGRLYVRKYGM